MVTIHRRLAGKGKSHGHQKMVRADDEEPKIFIMPGHNVAGWRCKNIFLAARDLDLRP